MLQDRDGRDVGEGLGGVDVGLPHLTRLEMEQVEGADDRAPQPHRQGMDGVEASGERLRREVGPAVVAGEQVLVHDRDAGAVAVEARALSSLELEQLEHAHGLGRRSHHAQLAVRSSEHDAGGSDVEHVDAAVGERVRSSTTSKSATSVSASSTSVRASKVSLDIGSPDRTTDGALVLTTRNRLTAGRVEAERSGHDVSSDIRERPVVSEGVGPETDERLADRDSELNRHHPGRLMDDEPEVGARLELGGHQPRGRVGLQKEHGLGRRRRSSPVRRRAAVRRGVPVGRGTG